MRWIAPWTVAVLLLCTIISCTGLAAELSHARQPQAPPCHQHQEPHQKPAVPQAANSCDHQQAIMTDSMTTPAPDAAWLSSANPTVSFETTVFALVAWVAVVSPPGPAVSTSVLRI